MAQKSAWRARRGSSSGGSRRLGGRRLAARRQGGRRLGSGHHPEAGLGLGGGKPEARFGYGVDQAALGHVVVGHRRECLAAALDQLLGNVIAQESPQRQGNLYVVDAGRPAVEGGASGCNERAAQEDVVLVLPFPERQ